MQQYIPATAITEARYTDQKRIIRTRWGSSVECKSADNEKSLVGEELDLLILDECAKIKFRAWEQHLRPTLSSRKGRALFITTPEGRNWVHGLFKRGQDPNSKGWESFTASSACNPHGGVRDDMLQAKNEMTPETYEQEYEAAFVSRKGLVYKTFSHARHVISPSKLPKTFDEIMCGVDYGFVNPSAILVIGVKDSRYYVLAEHYEKEMFDKDRKDVLTSFKRQYNFRYCYADHDAESNKYLLLAGFKMRKARKEVSAGLEAVAQKMMIKKDGKPSLFIVNSCTNLITELEGYSYHEKKDTTNDKEEPVKNDDHACDALRYAIYTRENPKGRVKTYNPPRNVIYG
jgi:phage terminase large subunit